jgi:hypothetical protein
MTTAIYHAAFEQGDNLTGGQMGVEMTGDAK